MIANLDEVTLQEITRESNDKLVKGSALKPKTPARENTVLAENILKKKLVVAYRHSGTKRERLILNSGDSSKLQKEIITKFRLH